MKSRRIGFGLCWVILFVVVFAVQIGHQWQLNERKSWMQKVDKKLESHDVKLDELVQAIDKLPESMLKRFKEIQESKK